MINAYFLPSLLGEPQIVGRAVVVIDVLRATTTIAQALASGARAVVPCEHIEEAQRLAAELGPDAVTGGERGGRRIEGFQLGNSPSEYTPEAVQGKIVVFTTTNGTRAMQRCRSARRILLAAFTNFSAVCQALDDEPDFDILCAGTDGHISREDVLLAGAIVADRLGCARHAHQSLNDQAEIAADVWRRVARETFSHQPLARILRDSLGGRNLLEIGHEDDIELAAQLDRLDVVPELDISTWQIRCAGASPTP